MAARARLQTKGWERTMNKLKACPFCGLMPYPITRDNAPTLYICTGHTEALAIEYWNRRPLTRQQALEGAARICEQQAGRWQDRPRLRPGGTYGGAP